MVKIELTPDQRKAVEDRGGSLLVSAAAGSGKTKVLVERLFRRIEEEQCSVDDFLIITYTRAAAAELRGKIANELSKRVAEQPESDHLRRQLLFPPSFRLPQPSFSSKATIRPPTVTVRSSLPSSWRAGRFPPGSLVPSNTKLAGRSASMTGLLPAGRGAAALGAGCTTGAGAGMVEKLITLAREAGEKAQEN